MRAVRGWLLGAGCFLGFLSSMAFGHIYSAGLENTVWQLKPSRLECRLEQAIPDYGRAVFYRRAGEEQQFEVRTIRPVRYTRKARVSIVPPAWRHDARPESVSEVSVKASRTPLHLGPDLAHRLLAELQKGLVPEFRHEGWYTPHPLNVQVSPVNFAQAYADYLDCVAQLVPKGYRDLHHVHIYYRPESYRLGAADKELLDAIIAYVKADSSIREVTVDGFSDNHGRRGHNWEVSRLRAQNVVDYLVNGGLAPEMIRMNYHGEPYPLVRRRDDTAAKRRYNRRTSISLLR